MRSGVITYYVKPERRDEFINRWNHLLAEAQEMPGFVSALLLTTSERNQAVGVGVWEDEKAYQAFGKSPVYRRFLQDTRDCLTVEPTREAFEVSGYSSDLGLQAAA